MLHKTSRKAFKKEGMCFWFVSSAFYDQKICDGWSLAAMFNEVSSKKHKKQNTNKKNPHWDREAEG